MDLLLAIYKNKSNYVCIKNFDRFLFHKTKNKNKNYFFNSRFSVLEVKMC